MNSLLVCIREHQLTSLLQLRTNDNSGNSPVFQHVLWCYVFCTLLQVVFKTLYNSFIDVVEAQIAVVDIGIKIFIVSLNAFLMIRFFCLFGICLFFVQWAVYLAIARLSWLEVVCLLLCMADCNLMLHTPLRVNILCSWLLHAYICLFPSFPTTQTESSR